MYLRKSNTTIVPDLEEVPNKYKKVKTKPVSINYEEYLSIPEEYRKYIPIEEEMKLDKDLYELEQTKLKKKEKFTPKVD